MKRTVIGAIVGLLLAAAAFGESSSPYTYNFPKPPAEWGQAVAFGNLSPGFFQIMYQNKSGVVRIATYGIVGASMDNLKDPQLMMVFAFDQRGSASQFMDQGKVFSGTN